MESIERINPFVHKRELMYPEHLGRYMFASQFAHGLDVMDCSCGNGYGSHYLAMHGAGSVTGIDIDQSAVDFSKAHYSSHNLRYQQGDGTDLISVPDNAVDVYVCFETIEHVLDVSKFLDEVRRVLKPGGLFIVSCPNDNIFNPNNPFHVDVYSLNKFVGIVQGAFEHVQLFVQNNTTGTCIMHPEFVEEAEDNSGAISLSAYPITKRSRDASDTWIAVCSDTQLPINITPTATFFTTYSDYIKEVQTTVNSLYKENTRLANAWEEHVQVLKQQEKIIATLQEENTRLANAWEEHVQLLKQQDETIATLQEENTRLANAWETHVDYIHDLEKRISKLQNSNTD